MRVGERLDIYVGSWGGDNQLRTMPDDAFARSASTALVTSAASGNVVTIAYTWADLDGDEQSGLLVLGDGPLPGQVTAVWVDSWHQQPRWMDMVGSHADSRLQISGAYGDADEQGGWHIHLHLDDPDALVMTMDNEMEQTGQYEAVRAEWRRT